MGINWIGIQCAPEGPHYLSAEAFAELAQWVVGPDFVAELSDLPTEEAKTWLKKSAAAYPVAAIELSDTSLAADLQEESIFYKQLVHTASDLQAAAALPFEPQQYVLSLSESWPKLRSEVLHFAQSHKVLLHAPLQLSEVPELKEKVAGLALDSTPEPRPGWQNYGFLAEVLELLSEE